MSAIVDAARLLRDSVPARLLVVLVAAAGLSMFPAPAGAGSTMEHVTEPYEPCHDQCGTVLKEICCTEPIG